MKKEIQLRIKKDRDFREWSRVKRGIIPRHWNLIKKLLLAHGTSEPLFNSWLPFTFQSPSFWTGMLIAVTLCISYHYVLGVSGERILVFLVLQVHRWRVFVLQEHNGLYPEASSSPDSDDVRFHLSWWEFGLWADLSYLPQYAQFVQNNSLCNLYDSLWALLACTSTHNTDQFWNNREVNFYHSLRLRGWLLDNS